MKKIVIILISLWVALPVFSESALNKKQIESAISTSKQAEALFKENPQWEDFENEDLNFIADPTVVQQSIAHLKKVGAYQSMLQVVKNNGFASLEEWHGVFRRTMLLMMNIQTQKLGMDFGSMMTMMEAQIKQLRDQGMPESVLVEQEKNLTSAKLMHQAVQNISEQDKKFASQNVEWLMQKTQVLGMGF